MSFVGIFKMLKLCVFQYKENVGVRLGSKKVHMFSISDHPLTHHYHPLHLSSSTSYHIHTLYNLGILVLVTLFTI